MREHKQNSWQTMFILLSAVILILTIWFLSYCVSNKLYVPKPDLPGVLLSAASLALFVLSIFLAFLAVIGWQTIQDNIRKGVEESTKRLSEQLIKERIQPREEELSQKIIALQDELQGRVFSILGLVIGETSIDHETFAPKNRDRLRDALVNCKRGYEILQKVGGPAEYMALNNLVFYSCLIGDPLQAERTLEGARLLRDMGQEHENHNLLLTYVRAVMEFGSDRTEIERALEIAEAIFESSASSKEEQREARNYLDSPLATSRRTEEALRPAPLGHRASRPTDGVDSGAGRSSPS